MTTPQDARALAEWIGQIDIGNAATEAAAMLTEYAALLERQGRPTWTDADADAARLAMELECLLTDKDVPMPALSRWWDSAHEALELHRKRMAEPPNAEVTG